MSISTSLNSIMKIFKGDEPTAEEQETLFQEVTLMTLARASASDSNIKAIEVETVRAIIQKVTGTDVSASDVRTAGHSALYESAPLEKYLGSVGGKIDVRKRVQIVEALAEVILSDGHISSREVHFFNMVAGAFQLTPAELAGLFETY